MLLKNVILSAGLASAVVTAHPAPQPANSVPFCQLPGQKCDKLKRAATAAADVLAQVARDDNSTQSANSYYCNLPGNPCHTAKRSAEALAEAVAEAYAMADPNPNPEAWRLFCGEIGEACFKVKRAAEIINSALDEPEPHAGHLESKRDECHAGGQDCDNAKHASDTLALAARRAVVGM